MIFVDFVIAEHALRETVRRVEMVQRRIHSRQKIALINSDRAETDERIELEELQKKRTGSACCMNPSQ